jgi:hypothetical protein
MHENVILSQASMAHAYKLRYVAFRDEEDGFQVTPGPKKKKKEEERERLDLKNSHRKKFYRCP